MTSVLYHDERGTVAVYRTGGDEFICMIVNIDRDSFAERVKKFTAAVTEAGSIAAVGSAYGDSGDKTALLKKAETAMYAMKKCVHGIEP